jgi:hypothetical protein
MVKDTLVGRLNAKIRQEVAILRFMTASCGSYSSEMRAYGACPNKLPELAPAPNLQAEPASLKHPSSSLYLTISLPAFRMKSGVTNSRFTVTKYLTVVNPLVTVSLVE